MDNPTNHLQTIMPFHKKPCTRQVALFSMLVAVSTAAQLVPRLGVEFTSLLTFSTGVVFGGLAGVALGVFVMFINAFFSPWGQAGLNMPFQMLGMGVIGAVGGLYKMENDSKARFHAEAAVLGAFLTFVYYLITNLGFAFHLYLFSRASFLEAALLAQVTGAVFTLLYTVSNTILFGVAVVPLANAMRKLLRR